MKFLKSKYWQWKKKNKKKSHKQKQTKNNKSSRLYFKNLDVPSYSFIGGKLFNI